ncbi:MAG: hypothetical protein OXU53_03265 [Deltaproteobacteria bacterium]|nr:hypothetical protein [Deltaproteobacteria bacterium]
MLALPIQLPPVQGGYHYGVVNFAAAQAGGNFGGRNQNRQRLSAQLAAGA